jgi:hypothetical protein
MGATCMCGQCTFGCELLLTLITNPSCGAQFLRHGKNTPSSLEFSLKSFEPNVGFGNCLSEAQATFGGFFESPFPASVKGNVRKPG